MKKLIKAFILIIIISLIFTNISFAGLADWTREEAEQQAEQDLQEQNEKQKEREGKSDNTYLSNLSVEKYEISPKFNKEISNYKIEEEIKENKIIINATAEDNKSTIDGAGEVILNTGINNIEIKVTAENGFSRVYYIIVTKIEKTDSSKLNNINISAIDNNNSYKLELSPKFDKNIYSYTCEVKDKIDKISIDCDADTPETNIRIIGNDDLPNIENVFTITVGEMGQESIYKILVYNKAKMEKTINLDNSQSNKKNYNYTIIVIIAIIIIAIICAVIILNKKKSRKTKH